MKRKSGVLMPVSSLPSPYGIGAFSKEAYKFVDFLAEAGQTYCHWGRPDTEIRRISHSPHLRETRILSIWISWSKPAIWRRESWPQLILEQIRNMFPMIKYTASGSVSCAWRITTAHMHCRSQSDGRDIRKRRRRLKHLLKSMRHGCRTMHFTVRSRMHLVVRA